AGATALGPGIRPAWEVPDPYDLTMTVTITRDGETAWTETASTGQLHRRIDELAACLFTAERYPRGAVLSTGTCLVPGSDFTLRPGDRVEIAIDGVGTLANEVRPAKEISSHPPPRSRPRRRRRGPAAGRPARTAPRTPPPSADGHPWRSPASPGRSAWRRSARAAGPG